MTRGADEFKIHHPSCQADGTPVKGGDWNCLNETYPDNNSTPIKVIEVGSLFQWHSFLQHENGQDLKT
jgi:hypothetical protein